MAEFSFTRISDSTYSRYSAASINDNGTVAFEAFQTADSPPAAIISGSGGPTTTVSDLTISGYNTLFSPTINNAETTVFASAGFGFGGPRTGILSSSDGTLAYNTPFSVGPSGYAGGNFVTAPTINNLGTVAYVAGENGLTSIKTYDNGVVTTIADSSGSISDFFVGLNVGRGSGPFSIYTLPAINDRGTVAFNAGLDAGGSSIITGSSMELTTIADTSGDISSFSSPVINNSQTVAFTATLDAGGSAIYTGEGGQLNTIADTNGLFGAFTSDTAFNDQGMVAFRAVLDDGGIGIFTGADPLGDKAIAVGDSLFGSTVTDVSIARNGLNEIGHIAFSATLADGTTAIARAEPVPEPSDGISVLALGFLFLLGWRWRQQKQSPRHPGC